MSRIFNTGYVFIDLLLYFNLVSKICFLLLVILKDLLIKKKIMDITKYTSLSNFFHTCFITGMSILLIILFNPITEKFMIIDHHIKIFLFTFGLLELIDIIKIPESISKSLADSFHP